VLAETLAARVGSCSHGELQQQLVVPPTVWRVDSATPQSVDPPVEQTSCTASSCFPFHPGDGAGRHQLQGEAGCRRAEFEAQLEREGRASTAAAAMARARIKGETNPCGRAISENAGLSWVAALTTLMGWITRQILPKAPL